MESLVNSKISSRSDFQLTASNDRGDKPIRIISIISQWTNGGGAYPSSSASAGSDDNQYNYDESSTDDLKACYEPIAKDVDPEFVCPKPEPVSQVVKTQDDLHKHKEGLFFLYNRFPSGHNRINKAHAAAPTTLHRVSNFGWGPLPLSYRRQGCDGFQVAFSIQCNLVVSII
uniref:Uncharacterized protein n=1 Tax=Ditylenchus dipsaci TaxID=166011 RepID=A0A915EJ30_9BILA